MSLDLKLKLLSGEPIEVDEGIGSVAPLTIRDIVKNGYTEYLVRLHFLTLEVKDFIGEDVEDKKLDIRTFDIITHYGDDDIRSEIENSLSLFLNESKVEINKDKHLIIIGDGDNIRHIDRDNFDKVREVIKWQNCINKFGEDDVDDDSEDNEAVRKIKEKLNKSREAVRKAKKEGDEGDDIDLSDIISAVSSKSNSINKLNVFDLTLYQLYDEFKRLELIDQYDIGIKSMLAGARDVTLNHWSKKINW